MGCAGSKGSSHDPSKGGRLATQSATMAQEQGGHAAIFVREVFENDVHEMYDFTGPVLGSGAFATVLRVKDRMSGVEYAIKQMDLSGVKDDPSTMRMLFNEIWGMKALNHPNIVRLQEVYRPKDEDMMYLVLDRLEGGSVDALRKQRGYLEEGFAAYIIAQVVDAVRYCHSLDIAHRDLKLANCMFEDTSPTPVVKVIDFGLCMEMKDGLTSSAFVGTMTYAAPEVIMKNKRHGIECDLWSIGVMTYALVGGSLPFDADDPGALQHQIKYAKQSYEGQTWEGVSALCRDFIDKCLNKSVKKRMTAKQAQAHPWIKRAVKDMGEAPLSKDSMYALMKFQEKNLFEKVALELVAYSYEPSQIKELEQRFMEMDKEGKGVVTLADFKATLLERRLAIVEKGQRQQQQQQQQRSDTTTKSRSDVTAADVPPNSNPPGTDTAAATSAPPGGASDKEVPPASAGQETVGGESVGLVGGEGGNFDGAVTGENNHGAEQASRAEASTGGEESSPPPAENSERKPKLTSSVSMEEVGALVHSLSGKGSSLIHSGSAVEARREGVGGATTPSSEASSYGSGRKLYRKQSSRTRTIGGLDEAGVERIFDAIDVDHSGTISITEFVAASLAKQQINTRAIKAAFNRLDHGRTGLITTADMSMYLGDDFDESKMAEYMREVSSRADGLVNLKDFTKCLKAHVLKKEGSSSRGSSRRVTTDSAISGGRSTIESIHRPSVT